MRLKKRASVSCPGLLASIPQSGIGYATAIRPSPDGRGMATGKELPARSHPMDVNCILSGDCVESMRRAIPDGSVDLVFADPPYFMQTSGVLRRTDGSAFAGVDDAWDRFASFEEYDAFCLSWLRECRRVLKRDGAIWVIGSFQNIYRLGFHMQNLGFWILNDVVWSKPNAVPNFGGVRLRNSHETLLWCAREKDSRFTFNYRTMKALNGGRQAGSVWDIGICIGAERLKDADGRKIHSTQKPEQLLYRVLMASTRPGDVVLDPFFGTGTTGAVARRTGRDWIGCEREQKYIDVAQRRISSVVQEMTPIERLELEVKPPRVPLKNLIAKGFLSIGEYLYDSNGLHGCMLCHDGKVQYDEDILSIHKMSAKFLNRPNNNGWDYFFVKRENSLVPINDLRYKYMEEFENEQKY